MNSIWAHILGVEAVDDEWPDQLNTIISDTGGWRFAQCFGDKDEVEDIAEGVHYLFIAPHALADIVLHL
jgi:hypothetical protein